MELNLLQITVGALTHFFIGMLWYSPAMFGKQWMSLIGLKESDMKKAQKNMGGKMLLALITAFIYSFGLIYLMNHIGVVTSTEGAKFTALLWLTFFATSLTGSFLWELKPVCLYKINVSYWLVSLLAMGAILPLF